MGVMPRVHIRAWRASDVSVCEWGVEAPSIRWEACFLRPIFGRRTGPGAAIAARNRKMLGFELIRLGFKKLQIEAR